MTTRDHEDFDRFMNEAVPAVQAQHISAARKLRDDEHAKAIEELFGDQVLALGSFRGKARASGVEWEQEFSQLVTLERGLVVRDRFFYSWDQGLRAAGLEPEDWT